MPEPVDTAILFEDVDVARTIYMKELYEESAGRFGSMTNRLIKMADEVAGGDGITMQAELGPADSVRSGNNPLPTFDSVGTFRATSVRLRFNSDDTSTNDFTTIYGSVQFPDILIRNGSMGAAVDIAKRVVNSLAANHDEYLAVARNVGRNNVIAYVNGTPTLNNGVHSATGNTGAATGTATNAGGLRCIFTNASVYAAIKENYFYDFVDATTKAVLAANVRCTDKWEGDRSCGFEVITSQIGSRVASTGNLATVGDGDYLVPSGTYNAGMYSIGAWSSVATAGESFVGATDRTTATKRWMLWTNPRYGAASAKITKSMFDDAAQSLGYRFEEEQAGLVCQAEPRLVTALRNELGEESFIPTIESLPAKKRFYNFGSMGLNYQHPSLGIIKINGDALCPGDVIRFIDPSTWLCQHYAFKGFQPLQGTKGNWYRVTASTPNTGDSTVWKSDNYEVLQDFCTSPKRNAKIDAVSPT